MMADAATLAFYREQAPRYTEAFDRKPSRHLDQFLDRLPRGARILELGCGGGRDSARIRERGFALDATDGTPAMVEKANQRFAVEARVMRFEELDAEAAYDAVWAHACLIHVPRADLPIILSAIHRALTPVGRHYGSYKLGDGEGRDLLGRLHNFPSAPWLVAVYADAGFAIEDTVIYAGDGADGVMRDWMALTVRRA
ncbi:MAG: class I SAM-dependent methyltransferase [Alphaproteobacteria bacterium]|nr:class I SAM-dependent methyltransferase [Alphaproteobacteria bacterium]